MKKTAGSAKTSKKGGKKASKGVPDYRKDRVLIAGYFDRSVKAGFRIIQAKYVEKSVQDLMTEAFTDLFLKYDVPQVLKAAAKREAED